uniref:Death domain-containing protein n=1 Tax=Branchiostoma floridae TaxID=7739 RepID=C3YI66_BRAFL|eukprot:XP_002604192.1 hypothetical protein BRAFLDRAFT_73465 [Branchiostoma floridae]
MQKIAVKEGLCGSFGTLEYLSVMTGATKVVVEQIPRGKKKGIMSDARVHPDSPLSAQVRGYGLLDFKVVPCTEDFKSETLAKEMKNELLKFSKRKEHAERDCCVVVTMTHGKEDHIYGTDGDAVPLATIFSMFDNDSCPSLSGKPKLFFVQACQGDKTGGNRHQAVEYSDGYQLTSSDTPVPPVWKSDMFIAYPSPWGYQSVRTEDGSPFLGAITKVFSEHAKDTNLFDMMTMVNREVSDASKGLVQPEVHSTLRKQLYFFPDHDVPPSIPVAPLTIHSYAIGTEGRVIQEAGGVELIFPKGCVSEERVVSVEPVTVTLPWMWRKYASKQQVNTTLMHFQPNRGWAVFSAHLQEADHTVTFKTFHFQSYFLVQTLNDAVHFVEKIWKGYAEDKVHLSIIPNSTTREITMLCTHKLQDQQEFFYITEEQLKHQFKQQVYMKSNEKIKAMITEESDIEIEKYDIPRGGITFYFPPATANRYSLRLKKREEASEKGVYEGSIQFDRVQSDGHTSAGTMEEAINNALIYLRPRSEDPHDVAQNFDKVVKSVGTSWKELALKLGLSYEAVQVIDQNVKLKDDFDKCRDALYQWRQINGKKATLEVLKDALSQIDMNSVRDEL